MIAAFGQRALYWLCVGIGIDLSQRLLDHWIDALIDQYPVLGWLD